MIGLGLGNFQDITLRGLAAVRNSQHVFLESYTSIYGSSRLELEEFFEREITDANRDFVESHAEKILEHAKKENVAFLVIGDVFGATTHIDLFLRAKEKEIDIKIINNTSVLNAVGITGLELYRFGRTASIVFDDDNWIPETPYEIIRENKKLGLHTLCLLDIKTAEPSKENLLKGIKKPEPPRFMTVNKGLQILLKIENKRKEEAVSEDMIVVGVARLGNEDMKIKAGKIKDIIKEDFGAPLHSLIIPGNLHDIEKEMLYLWK